MCYHYVVVGQEIHVTLLPNSTHQTPPNDSAAPHLLLYISGVWLRSITASSVIDAGSVEGALEDVSLLQCHLSVFF